MHGFISNFRLGPEFSAQANLFNERLNLDVLYLDTDMDRAGAQEIADDILSVRQFSENNT